MNQYQAYPSGPPPSNYNDPRLPPRPPPPQPHPQQQQRGRSDYPSFPPPSLPPYQSGPPAPQNRPPPQNHAGPSGYVNQSEQRYGGPSYGHNPHGQGQAPFRQDGSNYGSDHRSPDRSYPSLPPIHFTDRPPPNHPDNQRGYSGPHGQNRDQNQGYNSDPRGDRRQQDRRDGPRENFQTRDQSRRGRSPDSSRRPAQRHPAERDRDHRTIDQRMQLERPCRTLFVRNVNYEADTDALRSSFEQYGQIQNYFDLVKQRGMIFITYFDLRAAERARNSMHDSVVNKRKIDVHYSLPRPDDQKAPANRDSNQGSVVATLLRGPYLTENDLGRLCEQYGEIKSVRPGRSPEQKIVEFYDARGATLFYDQMNDRPFNNGTLELRFIWDEHDGRAPAPAGRDSRDGQSAQSQNGSDGRRGRRTSRDRGGGPGRGPDRRGHGGRGSIDHGGPGRRGSDASYQGGQRDQGPPGRYNDGPPQAAAEDRLEQARKVQDLLNSLTGTGIPPPPNPPQGYQPNSAYQPPVSARPGPNHNPGPTPYRSSDPRAGPPAYPPPSSYVGPPPQTYNYPPPNAPQSSVPPGSGGGGVPPEVLALLQANNVAQPPIQQQQTYPPAQPYPSGPPPLIPSGNTPYRPPPSNPPYGQNPQQQNHQQNGHLQQEQGYQPASGPKDVGSLLAMLQQNR